MDRRREKMVNESKKIVNNINEMSFKNLDDQQVHSLMMMREIANGIVNNRIDKQVISVNGYDGDNTGGVTETIGANMEIPEVDIKTAARAGAETVESRMGVKDIGFDDVQMSIFGKDGNANPTANGDASSSENNFGEWRSTVHFDSLGIPNLPSWSVQLPGDEDGTKNIQVPRAPAGIVVEGLPLSSYLPEPHKSVFEYLLELIAALKHMIVTIETQNRAGNQCVGSKPN